MSVHQLTVDEGSAGSRIDLFVGRALALSRAKLKALFDAGAVRVDGRVAKKGATVVAGQRITVDLPEGDPRPVPEPDLPLTVLHADDALVFVDKPAGAPSHPLVPGERGTVANALVARFPECAEASADPREGGLCHRLDVDTSGVMVAARTRAAWTAVREAFAARKVDKRYWAVVSGPIADEGEIDLPLRHPPRHPDRVEAAADGAGAREALTTFRVLDRSGEYALVEARIHTGVLHQVRAHLASIGAPLVGDPQYGGPEVPGVGRHLLHARSLALTHPVTGRPIAQTAEAPEDFRAALERLGLRA
ncbi:MAG: RluA family pseudouridine synthase [Myxococcaceae bacterium]|nr:RluA family pseudouridine synthase [Myxococcaceae bacterium]